MDPNACLNRILDAIMDEDWQDAHDALNELQLWTGRGGYKPTDPRRHPADEIIAECKAGKCDHPTHQP